MLCIVFIQCELLLFAFTDVSIVCNVEKNLVNILLGNQGGHALTVAILAHRLVTTGPYTYIRHPSYAGYIIASLTFFYFVGMRSWMWWLVEICRVALMNVFRIPQEEAVLHQKFGKEWEKYCRRTWRLFPFIF
ncbi:unnamed protein product [Ostreobium quekettii]|uniref:Protein-S-isoprenylcysteine O-methyltransferase n=1 Tax=Ostreobium quekettii TaxID=121088 RepID=A0A8S1J7J3_9CHLO|nr:unnamed protein product [Ostreobium quekettii]